MKTFFPMTPDHHDTIFSTYLYIIFFNIFCTFVIVDTHYYILRIHPIAQLKF